MKTDSETTPGVLKFFNVVGSSLGRDYAHCTEMYRNSSCTVGKTRLLAFECYHSLEENWYFPFSFAATTILKGAWNYAISTGYFHWVRIAQFFFNFTNVATVQKAKSWFFRL